MNFKLAVTTLALLIATNGFATIQSSTNETQQNQSNQISLNTLNMDPTLSTAPGPIDLDILIKDKYSGGATYYLYNSTKDFKKDGYDSPEYQNILMWLDTNPFAETFDKQKFDTGNYIWISYLANGYKKMGYIYSASDKGLLKPHQRSIGYLHAQYIDNDSSTIYCIVLPGIYQDRDKYSIAEYFSVPATCYGYNKDKSVKTKYININEGSTYASGYFEISDSTNNNSLAHICKKDGFDDFYTAFTNACDSWRN